MHEIRNDGVVVLRVRKDVPGVGRKLSRHFQCNEVTCNHLPSRRVREGAVVFNYGRSEVPIWFDPESHIMLNHPVAVGACVDKRASLSVLTQARVPCLTYTTHSIIAHRWLLNEHNVIARHTATGRRGAGIELYTPQQAEGLLANEAFTSAPLYTRHYDKTHEFRVHVFKGQVIDLVQKKKMGSRKREAQGIGDVDTLIRNHKRGWVFAHNNLICDAMPNYSINLGGLGHFIGNSRKVLSDMSISACEALGLDFGGVDILAKFDSAGTLRDAVVCEVNSAPGMSSTPTFNAYCNAIQNYMEEL